MTPPRLVLGAPHEERPAYDLHHLGKIRLLDFDRLLDGLVHPDGPSRHPEGERRDSDEHRSPEPDCLKSESEESQPDPEDDPAGEDAGEGHAVEACQASSTPAQARSQRLLYSQTFTVRRKVHVVRWRDHGPSEVEEPAVSCRLMP